MMGEHRVPAYWMSTKAAVVVTIAAAKLLDAEFFVGITAFF